MDGFLKIRRDEVFAKESLKYKIAKTGAELTATKNELSGLKLLIRSLYKDNYKRFPITF